MRDPKSDVDGWKPSRCHVLEAIGTATSRAYDSERATPASGSEPTIPTFPSRPTDTAAGGGHDFLDTDPGLDRYPVVFAHGNTRDACEFLDHVEYFVERGFEGDALWAIIFGREGSTHDEMRNQLEDFVTKIQEYTGVNKVQVLGHSLGVTGLRYWMDGLDDHPERYDRVEMFVSLAGANHGTHTCGAGCEESPGTARVCRFIAHDCARTRPANRSTSSTRPTRRPTMTRSTTTRTGEAPTSSS